MRMKAKKDLTPSGIYGTNKDNCDLFGDIINKAFLTENRLRPPAYLEYIFTLHDYSHA